MTFYAVLWGAASADILSTIFRLSLESVLVGFQVLLFAGPLVAFSIARRICLGLRQKDRDLLAHGFETGRIVRMPGGRYVEIHAPLPDRGPTPAGRSARRPTAPDPAGCPRADHADHSGSQPPVADVVPADDVAAAEPAVETD